MRADRPDTIPAGWAVELAVANSSGRARREAWRIMPRDHRFAKNRIVTVSRLSGGTVRWRGLATELTETDAIEGCLALRAQAGDDVCLVLTPEMVNGAFEEQGRLRRAMARR